MSDEIVEVRAVDQATLDGLKAWGWVSYILHLIVALAVVIPGAQVSVLVLVVALVAFALTAAMLIQILNSREEGFHIGQNYETIASDEST